MAKMSGQTATSKKFLQPIDRVALGAMLLLALLVGIVLLSGDRTAPRVRDFSWQNQQVGAEDTAFTLTFSRPMDRASVEANLKVNPPVPGKFSWAGRRMAYTTLFPVPYGNQYQVELKGAKDYFSLKQARGRVMQPFTASFRTRDRVFAYVGTAGEEHGRLILSNLTTGKKTILTPPDLVVTDFKPYPDGDRIVFAASDRKSQEQGLLQQQLYSVTTGISFSSLDPASASSQGAGQIDRVLDSRDYQILKFDLSPDGQTLIVQRLSRRNPADFGLWTITKNAKPRLVGNQQGGEFVITPDSTSIAIAQGQGVAILPLTPAAKPLDFLPKFGMVLSFANDGSAATMVKFNTDDPSNPTRSLFWVTNQGVQLEVLRTTGSILSCEFAPTKNNLYCLLTQLIQGTEEYLEEPFFAVVDLKAAAQITASAAAKSAADAAKTLAQVVKDTSADKTTEVDKAVKTATEATTAASQAAQTAQAAGALKAAEAVTTVAKALTATVEAAKASDANRAATEADNAAQAAKTAADVAQAAQPMKPLVVLPNQRDIQMSLSPDGLALLFDQLVTTPPSATDTLRSNDGQAIASGILWMLPLANIPSSDSPAQLKPEQLLPGFHPRWLP
jgi:hypothetical protein